MIFIVVISKDEPNPGMKPLMTWFMVTGLCGHEEGVKEVAQYIGLRYDWGRLHSVLGYRTLQEALTEYLNQQLAACINTISVVRKTRGCPMRR